MKILSNGTIGRSFFTTTHVIPGSCLELEGEELEFWRSKLKHIEYLKELTFGSEIVSVEAEIKKFGGRILLKNISITEIRKPQKLLSRLLNKVSKEDKRTIENILFVFQEALRAIQIRDTEFLKQNLEGFIR